MKMSLSTVKPPQTEQIMAFMCTMCHLKAPTEDEVKRHIFKVHLGQPVIKTETEIPLELHLGTLQPPPPPTDHNPPPQQIRFIHQPENANSHSQQHTIIIEDPSGNSILPKKEAVIEIIDDAGGINYRTNTSSILEPLVLDSVSSVVANPVNDLICAFCAFNTSDVSILENHIKSLHPNSGNSYPCMFCNFKATNSIRLFCTHLRVVHGNEIKSALSYHNTNATTSITTSSAPSTTIVDNGVTAHSIVSELMANENNQIIVSDDLNSSGGFQLQIVEPQSQQVVVSTAATTPTVTTNNFIENNGIRTSTGAALPTDPSKWFRCDSCNFVAGNARKLQHHKESRHLGIRYQCKQCTSSYTIRDKLTFHYSKQHNVTSYKVTEDDKIRVSFNMEIESKKFSCDLCDMKFTTRSAMYKHKRAKHLGLQYKCHLCNYSTGYRRGLKSHYENKHKDKNYTIPRALNGVFETAAVVQGEPKQIVGEVN